MPKAALPCRIFSPLQWKLPVWSCLSLKTYFSERFCWLPTETDVCRNIYSFLNLKNNLHCVSMMLKHCRKEGNQLYRVQGAFHMGSGILTLVLVNGDYRPCGCRAENSGSERLNFSRYSDRVPDCPARSVSFALCRLYKYKGQLKKQRVQ